MKIQVRLGPILSLLFGLISLAIAIALSEVVWEEFRTWGFKFWYVDVFLWLVTGTAYFMAVGLLWRAMIYRKLIDRKRSLP